MSCCKSPFDISKGQARRACPLCDVILLILALLVGDGAGSLAGGLARGLALTAAAVGRALLQRSAVQSLNMSHSYLLQFKKLIYYTTLFDEIQYYYFSTFPVSSRCPGA